MAILKCKMCGGDLNIAEGVTVCECEYCGTKQTVPTVDDEKKLNLFARANRLRFGSEFDKAAGVYESIVADFPEEAEAYWGLVLCRYGIEYVDDPKTGKKIPTCHRSSFDSVMDDANFDLVMEYADPVACGVYREEAKQIEELRRGIIAVSSKEAPYDIFICYKETDAQGERTIDSVIAQDVYTALTEKGYRVFFARISLEDKLGSEYEPYIFSALNSAKVMLVFGTKYEHFHAVWVKNEWSRFLQLIEKGEKKSLIPCFKGIDAYDMPKEFAKLQAQDMGKVGALQDLLRGIEKILGAEKTTVVVSNTQVTPLLERAYLFLEDKNWTAADEYCEKVLDNDPQCAEAYLCKLLVVLRVKTREEMRETAQPFDSVALALYQKAIRFGDEAFTAALQDDLLYIAERHNAQRYRKAVTLAQEAPTAQNYKRAANALRQLGEYADAAQVAQKYEQRVVAMYNEEQNRIAQKKKRRFVTIISISAVSLTLFLFAFCLYPLFNYWSGNYAPYIELYEKSTFTVPDNVTEIKAKAFKGCDDLREVTIPDGVVSIGDGAFWGCVSLTTVTIPDSVTYIGVGVFLECNRLETIYYSGTKEQWQQISSAFSSAFVGHVSVHCSDGEY